MSDENDSRVAVLKAEVDRLYRHLAIACAVLPVAPIRLPGTVEGEEVDVLDPAIYHAVRRVMEIANELPIPQERWMDLYVACAFWTSAVDLLGLQISQPDVDRVPQVTAQQVSCSELLDELMVWLVEDEG